MDRPRPVKRVVYEAGEILTPAVLALPDRLLQGAWVVGDDLDRHRDAPSIASGPGDLLG